MLLMLHAAVALEDSVFVRVTAFKNHLLLRVAKNDSIADGTMSILRWTPFFYQLLNPSISFDHFFDFVIVLLGIKVDNLRRDYY